MRPAPGQGRLPSLGAPRGWELGAIGRDSSASRSLRWCGPSQPLLEKSFRAGGPPSETGPSQARGRARLLRALPGARPSRFSWTRTAGREAVFVPSSAPCGDDPGAGSLQLTDRRLVVPVFTGRRRRALCLEFEKPIEAQSSGTGPSARGGLKATARYWSHRSAIRRLRRRGCGAQSLADEAAEDVSRKLEAVEPRIMNRSSSPFARGSRPSAGSLAPNWIGDSVMSLPFPGPQGGAPGRRARRSRAARPRRDLPRRRVRERGPGAERLPRRRRRAAPPPVRRGLASSELVPGGGLCAGFGRSPADRLRHRQARDPSDPHPGRAAARRSPLLTTTPCRGARHRTRPASPPSRFRARPAGRIRRSPRRPVGRPLVLLAPGSAAADTKRWPSGVLRARERLAEAFQLRGRDRPERTNSAARVPCGRAPLRCSVPTSTGGAVRRVRGAPGRLERSGPMHLRAVGHPWSPVRPTDPGRTAPSGAPFRVLDRYVFCSPCFRDDCPYGHECMRRSWSGTFSGVRGITGGTRSAVILGRSGEGSRA